MLQTLYQAQYYALVMQSTISCHFPKKKQEYEQIEINKKVGSSY